MLFVHMSSQPGVIDRQGKKVFGISTVGLESLEAAREKHGSVAPHFTDFSCIRLGFWKRNTAKFLNWNGSAESVNK